MRRTLKQLAEDLNVSTMTVSRALRGDVGVGEETRERIRRYANQVDYHPNLIARSLVARRTHALGIIIPNLRHAFWHEVIIAIEQGVRDAGYTVVITHSDDDPARERAEIELLVSRRVDALLIASCAPDCSAPALRRAETGGVPVLLFDRYAEQYPGIGVFSDDVGGARQAVRHLVSLGRRRIAHLAGDLRLSPARDRLQGYQEVMREVGLPPLVIEAGFGEENGYRAMQALLDGHGVDAVFAFHDYSAIGALSAALARGVRIPEDVALIGFCNTDCARHVAVPLTTVLQPVGEMGRQLASLVMQRIEEAPIAEPRVVLPTALIVRRSCGGVITETA